IQVSGGFWWSCHVLFSPNYFQKNSRAQKFEQAVGSGRGRVRPENSPPPRPAASSAIAETFHNLAVTVV
ncbi:hypothetical protein ACK6UM_29960, partial [Escherichia coli]